VYILLNGGDISDESLEAYAQMILSAENLVVSPDSIEVGK